MFSQASVRKVFTLGLLLAFRSFHALRKRRHSSDTFEKLGDSARVHGVKVVGYYTAFRAGVALHEEQDYSIGEDGISQWIISFNHGVTEDQIHRFCSDLASHGASCEHEGHPDHGGCEEAAVRASKSSLRTILEADANGFSRVRAVEANAIDQASQVPWGLDRSDQERLPLSGSFTSPGNQGEGIHVYVLDTGIRTSHNDFGGRAIPTWSAFGDQPGACDPSDGSCALDGEGHGTHCAGTVGGAFHGVAKRALLHAVKVLNDEGSGNRVKIIEAMDWVGSNKQGDRAVISMSLGGRGQSPAYETAIDNMLSQGIVTVVASGNFASDACAVSPAYVPNAITVSSTDRGDQKSWFSNVGPCVDLWAPGSDILSCGIADDDASKDSSGTSMACPHVAGAAAVLFSNFDGVSAAEIKGILLRQATPDVLSFIPQDTPNIMLRVSMGIPAPTPAPPPTPPPPPGWEIWGSGCELVDEGECISSLNFPADYGVDESCTIIIHGSVSLAGVDAADFQTEACCDKLRFSSPKREFGGEPPQNLGLLGGEVSGNITWASDKSVVSSGWKLCQGTFVPPPAPTPPAPTPPAPPGDGDGSWEVVGTGCQLVDGGDCIESRNFTRKYWNSDSCTIVIHGSITIAPVEAADFQTEACCDTLMIPSMGLGFGGTPPFNLASLIGEVSGNITWSTDTAITNSGWKICKDS